MAHKVHPKIYRIKEIQDWETRGFYKNPALYLEEDFKIREFLEKKLAGAWVEKIEIERFPGKLTVIISTARPGLVVGRGGGGIEELKKELDKILQKNQRKTKEKTELKIEVKEVKNPWLSASLVAQWMAQQIEKRLPYRRVLKQALDKILGNKEVQGARVEVAGRLDGAEIARKEFLQKGKLPRQTLRANIDYAQTEAFCTYGVVGVKVWIYKGEKFS